MRWALGALMLAVPSSQAEVVGHVGPSGLRYTVHETLFEPAGAYDDARRLVRLRFVAPEISDPEHYGIAQIEADFQTLCDAHGVEIVAQFAPNARQIVISVSAEPVAFGDSAPNVVQYFDLFRVDDNTCVWEGI